MVGVVRELSRIDLPADRSDLTDRRNANLLVWDVVFGPGWFLDRYTGRTVDREADDSAVILDALRSISDDLRCVLPAPDDPCVVGKALRCRVCGAKE
jgi:hypothetical protein